MNGLDIHPKTAGAATGCAIVTIGLWALQTFAHVQLPPGTDAIVPVIGTLIGGWLPSSPSS